MLILGSKLINTPVLGLQTGSQLALTSEPLVDPKNLQIVAFKLESPLFDDPSVDTLLRVADIRELSKIGFIIDSADEFISPTDVIKINEIYNYGFNLIGLKVIDQKKNKLGIIQDFTLNLNNFIISQLIVKRPLLKSFNDPELTINRNQIYEINDDHIVVKSETEPAKTEAATVQAAFSPNYVNPFRSSSSDK